MRKTFLIMAFIMSYAVGLKAQDFTTAPTNPNAPVIKIDRVEHDYGTIYQNADGNTYFVYTNTGQEPLILSRVKSSCGCTVPKWSRQPLLTGQSDTLKVRYDTKRIGTFHKTITIMSNATVSRLVVNIKGKVIEKPSIALPTKNVDNELSPINK